MSKEEMVEVAISSLEADFDRPGCVDSGKSGSE